VNTINSKGLHGGEMTGAAIFDLNGQKIYELNTDMQDLEEMAAKLTGNTTPPRDPNDDDDDDDDDNDEDEDDDAEPDDKPAVIRDPDE
jgi:hypothetical protein